MACGWAFKPGRADEHFAICPVLNAKLQAVAFTSGILRPCAA